MALLDQVLGQGGPDPNDPRNLDPSDPRYRVPGAMSMTGVPPQSYSPAAPGPNSAAPSSASPATPVSVAPSANPYQPFLDKITADQAQQQDLISSMPTSAPVSKTRSFLAALAGIGTGLATRNVQSGINVGERIRNAPLMNAQRAIMPQIEAAKGATDADIKGFDVQLQGDTANRANQDTQSLIANRADEVQNRAATLGIDQQRLANENPATKPPQNEAELALAAHRLGPDGKPTPDALTAAAALKDMRLAKINEVVRTRDPNDRTKLLRDLQSNDTAVRGQLDRELAALESRSEQLQSSGLPIDPATQAQIAALKKSMSDIDEDAKTINDEMKKGVGLGGPPQAPATSTAKAPAAAPKARPGFKLQKNRKTGETREVPQ